MTATTIPVPAARGALLRPAVAIAAIGSAMAGIVHVDAALNHEGAPLLTWMFALCAVAQLGWGALVMARPSVSVLRAGVVINAGALVFWAVSRSIGIPFVAALATPESVGRPDLGGALFAGASVLGAVRVLVRPTVAPRLTTRWLGAMAALALLAGMPALTAKHTDGHGATHLELAGSGDAHDPQNPGAEHDQAEADGGHASARGADHTGASTDGAPHDAHATAAATGEQHHSATPSDPHAGHTPDPADPPTDPHAGHTPDPAEPPTDPHAGHDPDPPTDPTDPPTDPHAGHDPDPPTDPTDPIVSLDDPRLTPEQFDAAIALIIGTTTGMSGFLTEADVLAAGYLPIGDGGQPGTYSHFVNWSYLTDEYELDPTHIEAIVMKMNADGTSRVVSAMYILSLGKTMADAPDIAGELTTWHDHDNLCFSGNQLVALAVDGVCPSGVLVNTPPMLHVWIEANGCGPFVGIDEHGINCEPTEPH
ncbi:MAG: hypothetical protein ACT4OV_16180 [Microthrixaceae bacterium]